MRISQQPPIHLTYCLNVHAGEFFEDQWRAIRDTTTRIRTALGCGSDQSFGLGLRLGHQAVLDAKRGQVADSFGAWCRDHGFYIFTINGFPYGSFHQVPVKEKVYRPDWTSPARRDYTMALGELLAGWLPENVSGSISTVPGWYGPDYSDNTTREAARRAAFRNLLTVARHLETLAENTGRDLCLGLEPEPWCFLESTSDAVAFYQELFAAAGADEAMVRRRIGLCVDTCHCAVVFERPADAIRRMCAAGIRLAKIQLSAALIFSNHTDWMNALKPFDDAVYVHQVAARSHGGLRRWPDLPEALTPLSEDPDWIEACAHYHVPLYGEGAGCLRSTRANMDEDFWRLVHAGVCPHLEIETYTFDVLPVQHRDPALAESIVREYRWALSALRHR